MRRHKPALAFLRDFSGAFQTDGYAAYDKALDVGSHDCRQGVLPAQARAGIVHFNCMAHCRRGFVEALESGDDRAAPFLACLGALYGIEVELREASPQARAQAHATRSVPWLASMEVALKKASLDLAILPRSALSKAVGYALPLAGQT